MFTAHLETRSKLVLGGQQWTYLNKLPLGFVDLVNKAGIILHQFLDGVRVVEGDKQ